MESTVPSIMSIPSSKFSLVICKSSPVIVIIPAEVRKIISFSLKLSTSFTAEILTLSLPSIITLWDDFLDYLEKLVNDILTKYPAGELPPIEKVTQRKKEDIEAVIKGPANGGRHIYTLTY